MENFTMTRDDVYQILIKSTEFTESNSWTRFNNYLIVVSLLVLSWIQLFTKNIDKQNDAIEMVLYMICLMGIFLGIIWAVLGWRGRKWNYDFLNMGKALENTYTDTEWPKDTPRLFRENVDLRDKGFSKCIASRFILVAVPLLFSLIFAVMLWLSVKRWPG
jgi:hypothetical protein